ncbi:MAG: zinc dependent phospholipase C family protein [Candidatus Binataceae bacterium]
MLCAIALFAAAPAALAWDSGTHRMIARLALNALPDCALKDALAANERALQSGAVAPDTTLRDRYGHAEAIRHYIDLERYGADPLSALSPDLSTMLARYGRYRVDKAGTLPWTIESEAAWVRDDWQRGDCAGVITHSGYLAHYVGDASQPLHTTIRHDCSRAQRGCHARIENAANHRTNEIEHAAAPQVHLSAIEGVWPAALAEISRAHAMVARITADDRAARMAGERSAYTDAIFANDSTLFSAQIADAASTLASIWLFEWKQAGSPNRCTARQ